MTKAYQNAISFIEAYKLGNTTEVNRLWPISDYNIVLYFASAHGFTELVEKTIPLSDPKSQDSMALLQAVQEGHIECVKLLIPVSDPKTRSSQPLFWAVLNEHTEIVQLLIPVSDYNFVLQTLHSDCRDTTLLQQCIDEYEALQQKDRLNNTLAETIDTQNNSVKRKM